MDDNKNKEDEHKVWGGVYFLSGTVAMICLGLAVFVDGITGKVLAGTLFTICVVSLLFWAGMQKDEKNKR